MAMTVSVGRYHLGHGLNGSNLRLILIQGCVTTPAKVIGCAKLNEQTVVATNNFPGINRG